MDRLLAPLHRHPVIVSLILGAIAATGFAPLDLWPLTLLALAGWIALLHRAGSLKRALWIGYAFGVGHFTVNDNWFQHAFDFQDKMPPVLGYFAAVGLALYLAVYPAIAAGFAWRTRRPARIDIAFVLMLGAAWILAEWLRAVVFTGYAWDPLGVVWIPVIGVARLAAFVGTYSLSGLTIVAAGSLLLVRRQVAIPAGIAAALGLAALSALWTNAPAPPPGAPLIRVVQPNIGNEDRGKGSGERALRTLISGSGTPGPTPRLIVWPEGLLDDFLEDHYPPYVYSGRWPEVLRSRIARELGPRDTLLTSADTLSFDASDDVLGAANSVLAIAADTRIVGRYDKAHLVPYGEYLPMPWLLKPLGLARLVPGDMDFTPGPGPRNIVLPRFGTIGVQVCYEIVFSGQVVDERNRPRMIFNPSNDAWFGRWGPPQHLAQARMRAIEEGLPIARATPTGISAVIAADGRLLGSVPHRRAGAIEMPIPPALVPTLFSRIGNWMALFVGLALVALAVAIRKARR
jgi:apolipoprotein N-acyltransferase